MSQLSRKVLNPTLWLLVLLALIGLWLYFGTNEPLDVSAYLAMMVFYTLIFFTGAYAATLREHEDSADVMLAGRTLPLGIAIFTMSATWVGGGYINGTSEYTAESGLVWVQAPWGYALSLILGGIFFAGKMRRLKFKTMLDPLEQRFGKRLTALFLLPAISGEIFWSGAILTALGTTFGVIVGLETNTAIIVSAAIAVAYTALGGLWAVALTDFVQMILLLLGLAIVVPFALGQVGGWQAAWMDYQTHFGKAASLLPSREALGDYYWVWWDYGLLLIFGGIPWQVYFQRVLAAKDAATARWLSIFAGLVCLIAAVPAAMIGVAAEAADWSALGLSAPPDAASTLPWVVRYLTPEWVATLGLGAVAAAVMSSTDSSILSASSLLTWNMYRPLVRPGASPMKLGKVIRRCIWIIGTAATLLALNVQSIYALWFLCSDFVYCLLFPALVCALFYKYANAPGALAGFVVAFILRFGGGDTTLGIPVLLPYPMVENGEVLFPFRTLSMSSGLVCNLLVSRLTQSIAPARPLHMIAD